MIRKVYTSGVIGIDGIIVEVEIGTSPGLPDIEIIGLPDSVIKEAKERVKLALINQGYELPRKKIVINLAPAFLKKRGSSMDLGIAMGLILISKNFNNNIDLSNTLFIGEIGLDGNIKPTNGILPMVIKAKKSNFKKVIVPYENYHEASFVKGLTIYPIKSLKDIGEIFTNNKKTLVYPKPNKKIKTEPELDYKDVIGQEFAKRALMIAAAGRHNILLIGSPGVGKSMLINRLPTIMPPMTDEEKLETTIIYSIKGLLKDKNGIIEERPFRNPHHTTSDVALVGGGKNISPGEISLAHNGILFLDEFPEFKKTVIQSLREPLETGEIVISRANGTVRFPANFLLAVAMNPCPCGYLLDKEKNCTCHIKDIKNYLKKIKGPIIDRIDIHIEIMRVKYKDTKKDGLSSKEMRELVIRAYNIQKERFKDPKKTNSRMNLKEIKKYCQLTKEAENLLKMAYENLKLSLRSMHKILKVSRTIADLSRGGDIFSKIDADHIAEALNYRAMDRLMERF